MYLKTSLSAGIMIYNLKKNLRIVGLHRHYVKPNARVFSATDYRENYLSLCKQIYTDVSALLGLKLL